MHSSYPFAWSIVNQTLGQIAGGRVRDAFHSALIDLSTFIFNLDT